MDFGTMGQINKRALHERSDLYSNLKVKLKQLKMWIIPVVGVQQCFSQVVTFYVQQSMSKKYVDIKSWVPCL